MLNYLKSFNKITNTILILILASSTASTFAFDPPTSLGTLNGERKIINPERYRGAIINSSNKLIFSSDHDSSVGNELYVTDLTTNATTLLKDIDTGTSSSGPNDFRSLGNNKVVFSAYSVTHGREIWITDGTPEGTVELADINNVGSNSSVPTPIYTVSFAGTDYAIFVASGSSGNELYVYNGTTLTMTLVDIQPGAGSSDPEEIYIDNESGTILFSASTSLTGREPYRTTVTAPATFTLIGDINPGVGSSAPRNFSFINLFGGESYYSADDGVNGQEPYRNNALLGNVSAGATSSNPGCMTRIGSDMFMVLYDGAYKIYQYNGTFNEITTLPGYTPTDNCQQINTGATWSSNKMLLYSYNNPTGSELWVSDGTAPGTTLLKEIRSGNISSAVNFLTRLGSGASQRVIFAANDDINGRELWSTDGTTLGTTIINDTFTGPNSSSPKFYAKGDSLAILLSTTSFTAPFQSFIKTDGTSVGTSLVRNYNDSSATVITTNDAEKIATIGEKTIFKYFHPGYGFELFVTDGTSSGTKILKDINVGEDSGINADNNLPRFVVNNKLLFSASENSDNWELWATDGTTDGTTQLKDIYVGTGFGSFPKFIGILNGFLYFIAGDSSGQQLYKTDGTTAGTTKAFDVVGNFFGYTGGVVANNQIFLACDINSIGWYELCKSDGTLLGTTRVKDISPGALVGSTPEGFTVVGNRVVFFADDGINGVELWSSDGTEIGTEMLSDALAGISSQLRYRLFSKVFNNIYYFNQSSDAHGDELWRTDGTVAGTFRLTDINAGVFTTNFYSPTIHDNKLFFSATSASGQVEIYRTDGTFSGTNLFLDISGGVISSNVNFMESLDGYLFFSGYRSAEGQELFYIQGSDTSTLTVFDNVQMEANPAYLFSARGSLYFQGFNNLSKYVDFYKLVVDACPDDNSKTTVGVCGCGVPDADTDLDGTFNCLDSCTSDPAKTSPGVCGCGVPDADTNGNGQLDCTDDTLLSLQPSIPTVRYNKRRDELTFTMPAYTGVRYVVSVSQLKSKNGRVVGRKRFETTNRTIKKKLSRLLIKGKRLKGWISVTYQLKIGTRLGVASRAKKLKI